VATSTTLLAQSILQVNESKVIAKFAGLTRELIAAEAEVFGTDVPEGLAATRDRLIAAISRGGTSQLQIALEAAEYKVAYKAQKQWVRCGTPIAKAAGYKGVTGLNSLINDAQLANKLPPVLLAAMIEAGLDPVEHRHATYIKHLLTLDFSGGAEEARMMIEGTHSRWVAEKRLVAQKKKEDKRTADKDTPIRIARQVASDLASWQESERHERLKSVLKQIEVKANKLLPGARIQVLWSTDDTPDTRAEVPTTPPAEIPTSEVTSETVNLDVSSGIALVPQRTATARAKCIPQPGLQPFGAADAALNSILGCSQCLRRCERCDAAENVLRLAQDPALNFDKHFDRLVRVDGSATRPIEFTCDVHFYPGNLYEVLREDPRVYTLPCCADLLDPAMAIKVTHEHISVMRRASQHVFVISTRHADRLRDLNDWVLGKYRVWPPNIFMGVEVFGRCHLDRVSNLGRTGADLKWVDLSRWRSEQEYEARILLGNDLRTLLKRSGIGWVNMGPRVIERKKLGETEKADLCYLLTEAIAAGCRVHFNQFKALERQLRPYLTRYGGGWSNGKMPIDDLQQAPVFPPRRAVNVSDFEPAFIPGECYHY